MITKQSKAEICKHMSALEDQTPHRPVCLGLADLQALSRGWPCLNYNLATFKLIDKMSLGAGAEKVEGPIVQKRSVALEATMATKRAPTTQRNLRLQCLEAGGTARIGAMGHLRPQHPKHPQWKRRTCMPKLSLKASRMMKTISQQKVGKHYSSSDPVLEWHDQEFPALLLPRPRQSESYSWKSSRANKLKPRFGEVKRTRVDETEAYLTEAGKGGQVYPLVQKDRTPRLE